ncbi:MAG: methyltransferase domain-containing protein [Candidatus Krumholzibacteria bacterium]|nr:methyltransferase domain-containing protein [Candidatus Krumholzibacteria bacterium]MDH4338261.1 methyltransferase domain-containing protein [Candidatus Krumholzibacteria bacterium]MDH5271059.1 methyltransferase domain-containing protein [Candidatus Krumholzibacteria bacterium]
MTDSNLEAQIRAATVYEEFFVPALFSQWTHLLAKVTAVRGGSRVLDVGCGTGIFARDAARLVGSTGFVAGVDPNPGMLTVALRVAPELEWREGVAAALPYDDGVFDVVASQFGLMFFDDRIAALRDMKRVLAPGGRLGVAVWDALDNIPAYSILVALIQHLVGKRAADALRQPFVLGNPEAVRDLFERAGMTDPTVETYTGVARYPSIRSWVLTDVKGWFPLVDVVLDKSEYDTLATEAERALGLFTTSGKMVEFPISVHMVSASK